MNIPESDNQNSKVYDVADVLEKFGKYQAIQFLFSCLTVLCITMVNINYIFIAGDMKYRCRIPECEGPYGEFEVGWWPNASIDRCSKPLLRPGADHFLGSQCTNESFSGLLETCEEWVYESNNTIVASLNMACQPWKVNLIGTVHSTGMLVSMIVGGWMSDRFGRKPILIFCGACSAVGQLKTVATSYYMYVFIEFCEAVVTGGCYSAAMVLMLEICGKENRIMAGIVFTYASIFGECLYATIAMFVPYWKNLIHIINAPSVFFLALIFLIRESPRWQIVSGKIEKAKNTILIAAKINNININREDLAKMDEIELKNKFNIAAAEKKEGLKEIVNSKEVIKRAAVASFCRFTTIFVYLGMMISSVYLPGNKYTNFLLSTAISFPGPIISLYLLRNIGRKWPLMTVFLLSGLVCVGIGLVPSTVMWAKILLFLLGKMLIAFCFTVSITYAMELFPTSARGSLIGFTAFAARIGGMLAPMTPVLNSISEALPSILFGCSALISAVLLTLTPETKGFPLMETIHHVEESVGAAKVKKTKKAEDNAEVEAGNPPMSLKKEVKFNNFIV